MEWNKFTESKKEYPEELILKSIDGFSKATNNLLDIQVGRINEKLGDLYVDFEFKLLLTSNTLKSYKFEILRFGYDVELYPVKLLLEESIFEEVYQKKMGYKQTLGAPDEEALNSVLKEIFSTNRFKEVVSGLMKISRKYEK